MLDEYYPQRPDELENCNLYNFMSRFIFILIEKLNITYQAHPRHILFQTNISKYEYYRSRIYKRCQIDDEMGT